MTQIAEDYFMIMGQMRCFAVTCALVYLAGCQAAPRAAGEPAVDPARAAPAGAYDKLGAILWTQQAAEHRAGALQAFAWAQRMFDQALADPAWTAALEQEGDFTGLRPAVIVDADETVLDNSPYQARVLKEQVSFDPATWHAWVEEARAGAVPGAVEFARYVVSRGGRIFYVTNRDASVEAATRKNLAALGFPLDAEVDTVLMKDEQPGWTGDKTTRRALVARDHRVVLLIGDNVGDFVGDDVNRASLDERNKAATDTFRGYWGRKWIVIPNPMYGTWESAVLGYGKPGSESERVRRELDALDEGRPAAQGAPEQRRP